MRHTEKEADTNWESGERREGEGAIKQMPGSSR